MGEEIYYKTVLDLTAKELALIYDQHPACQYPYPIPRYDKSGIVMNLLNIEADFLTDIDKKYHFRKINQDLKYDRDYDAEAVRKTARSDHKIDIDRINQLIELKNLNSILLKIEEESKTESKTESQNSTGDLKENGSQTPKSQPNPALGSSSGSKTGSSFPTDEIDGEKFKMKIPKFDSQLPIENWLTAMEIFKACSKLSDENLIKVSLTKLLEEESGTSLIEAINPDELVSWEKFKMKLKSVLGKDREHFKHMYNTFQRGSESQAMALTKITAFFKKGYGKKIVDDADQQIICEKFISSQEPRLMELLQREKSLLNLRNVAQRATELERSFFKRENVFIAEN